MIMSKVPKVGDKREVAVQAQIGPQKEDEHAITEVKISIKHVPLRKTSCAYTYTCVTNLSQPSRSAA
jgi:hypothetical protein